MKKIYLAILALAFFNLTKAQTLTLAANQPAAGDAVTIKYYDSTNVQVPKATGAGMSWNFSAFSQSTLAPVSRTYSLAAAVPSSSDFPGCTLAEVAGNGDFVYWKAVASPSTQFELIGIKQTSGVVLNFTNSAVVAIWPVAFGYNNTDLSSGTVTAGVTGTMDGTTTVQGSGTGTLTLPNGPVFSNILQTKTAQTITLNIGGGLATATVISTDYDYYHSSQKYPMLTVSYEREIQSSGGSPTITLTHRIKVNNAVITGLNEKNFDATFSIFPNPAKDAFNVNLTNTNNDDGVIEIYNNTGALIKTVALGNTSAIQQNISLIGLSSGIYIVKTTLGKRISSRKLIID